MGSLVFQDVAPDAPAPADQGSLTVDYYGDPGGLPAQIIITAVLPDGSNLPISLDASQALSLSEELQQGLAIPIPAE